MRRLIVDGRGHLRVYKPPEDPLPGAELAKRWRLVRSAVVFVNALCVVVMATVVVVVGKNVALLLASWPPGIGRALVALGLVSGGMLLACLAGVGLAGYLGGRLGRAYGAYVEWYEGGA